jgi:hypothetical protein
MELVSFDLETSGRRRHDARGGVKLLAPVATQMWRRLPPDYTSFPIPGFSGVLRE